MLPKKKKKWWQKWWGILIIIAVFLFVIRVGQNYLKLRDAYYEALHKEQVISYEKQIEDVSGLNEEQNEKIMELWVEFMEILTKPLNQEQKEFMLNYLADPPDDTDTYIEFRRIYNIAWSKLSDEDKQKCIEIDKETKKLINKWK